MIKFTGSTEKGGTLIGLGLSRKNCERLLQHKPIIIDLEHDLNLPFPGKIVILGGETEESMTAELREFITPETEIYAEPGLEDPRK